MIVMANYLFSNVRNLMHQMPGKEGWSCLSH